VFKKMTNPLLKDLFAAQHYKISNTTMGVPIMVNEY
jgi:hypothetical protein